VVSPGWALQRAQERERLNGYRNARPARTRREVPAGGGADTHLEEEDHRWRLMEKARQAERDYAIADAILTRSVEHTVGAGPAYQAQTADPTWNAQAEELWSAWAETPERCDARGLLTFGELLALFDRGSLRDGDAFWIRLSDGTIQSIEADQVLTPWGQLASSSVVGGVELDVRGRPRAILVGDRAMAASSVRVPIGDVVWLAERSRAGQTRGLTRFASSLDLIEQTHGVIDSTVSAARAASCLGLVITSEGRFAGSSTDADGKRRLSMEPGGILELLPGETVTPYDPSSPTTTMDSVLLAIARLAGAGFGLPVELSLMDMTRSNYSQARGALLLAQTSWRVRQAKLRRACDRILFWRLLDWMASGALPLRADALARRWVFPGWRYSLDPLKETHASLARLDGHLTTHAEEIAAQGWDSEEVMIQRAQELSRALDLGLPVVRSRFTRDPDKSADADPEIDAPDEQE
jgi:lambda family phage portal protein